MSRKRVVVAGVLVPTLFLTACCAGGWSFNDKARQAVSEFAPDADVDQSLEYDCDLPETTVALLDKAVMILEAEERYLTERHKRWKQALTEGEKARLAEVRDVILARLYDDLDQLKTVAGQAMEPAPTARLGIVYEVPGGVASVHSETSTNVEFGHAGVFPPKTDPEGAVARDVSSTQALAAILDRMRAFAKEEGVLDEQALEELGSW